jgi:hypothetical protein
MKKIVPLPKYIDVELIIINHLINFHCNEEIIYFINHVFAGICRLGS